MLLDAIRQGEKTGNDGIGLVDLAGILGLELADLSPYIADLQWLLDNGHIMFVECTDRFKDSRVAGFNQ